MERELVLAAMLRRLNTVTGLDDADIAAIRALPIVVRQWEAGRPIVSDGDRPTDCCLVIEGFCVRAKTTVSGQRQILSIHIPGDIPDLQSLHLRRMDHSRRFWKLVAAACPGYQRARAWLRANSSFAWGHPRSLSGDEVSA